MNNLYWFFRKREAWDSYRNTIAIKNSLAKSKDLNFNLVIKESTRKMFLSGEWDATATLLQNASLVEKKSKELPYIKGVYDLP